MSYELSCKEHKYPPLLLNSATLSFVLALISSKTTETQLGAPFGSLVRDLQGRLDQMERGKGAVRTISPPAIEPVMDKGGHAQVEKDYVNEDKAYQRKTNTTYCHTLKEAGEERK